MKYTILILMLLGIFMCSSTDAIIRSGSFTLKTADGDYSTFAAFWNDLYDTGTLIDNITLTMDASTFTEDANSTSYTGDLNGKTILVTPVSFPTKTDISDGARFTRSANGGVFIDARNEGAGAITIEGMSVNQTGSTGVGVYTDDTSVAYTLTVRRCVFKEFNYAIDHHENTGVLRFYNNVLYDNDYWAVFLGEGLAGDSWFANNTVVRNDGEGVRPNGAYDTVAENNLVLNNPTTDFSINSYQIINNNICSDASCDDSSWYSGSSNNITNYTDDPFTASSSDDFTLASGSTPVDAGKDLSADFTDDFFGVERDANFDIGACELSGNTAPTIVSINGLPDPVTAGDEISFSVDWDDEDTEGVKLFVCTTDAVTTSTPACTVATWCSDSNDYDTTDPLVCATTTLVSQVGSGQAYYVFVCDDEVECSTSTSGSFTVHAVGSKAFKLEGVMKIEGGTVKIE